MPQDAFFHELTIFWWAKNDTKTFFSHPPSPFPGNFCNCNSGGVLLCNSRFKFHCYTQHEATPTQKLARKWRCNLSWLLMQKDYKGHSLVQTSFTEPPNKYTTLVDIKKMHYKKLVTHESCRITYEHSESAWEWRIVLHKSDQKQQQQKSIVVC